MINNLNEAVERIWNISKWILLNDLYHSQDMPNVPVGAENGWIGHGMMYVFATEPRQVNVYAPNWVPVMKDDQSFAHLHEPDFPQFVLDHITKNKERARMVLPGKNGYFLALDTAIRDFTRASISSMEAHIGTSLRNQERPLSRRLMEELPDWQLQEPISMEQAYRHFNSTTYSGAEATRTETALGIAVGEGIPVISARQLVESQGEHDIIEKRVDEKTGKESVVRYSRIGLGRILQYGARGLERDSCFRIRKGVPSEDRVLTLYDKRGNEFPVVLEEQTHRFDEKARRVMPHGAPIITGKEALEDAVRSNPSS